MTRPHRHLSVLVLAVLAAIGIAAPAQAAQALTASVVGEAPQGNGVFRFPQAVAVTSGGGRVFVGDEYSSVVQAFDAHGGFLFNVGARATRDEPGRLGVVGGVAVDKSDHLYVVDAENDRIQIFSASDGHFITTFGDASTFNLLGGSAADGAGITAGGISVYQSAPGAAPVVYIADEGNDRVVRQTLDPSTLQPSGAPVATPASLGLEAPQGLAIDASGQHLYVADDDHHRVVELAGDTLALLAQTGSFGTGPGQLNFPYDIAIDSSSPARIYVADNINGRVQVFDAATLAFVATLGTPAYGPGVGNLEIVRALGSLPDAPGVGISVADTANNRIQTFDASGNVTAAWGIAGRGPGYVTRPRGVTFAPDGGVTVADTFDARVARYSPDGTFVDQRGYVAPGINFVVPGTAAGQFTMPVDAGYDGAGNLWVSDADNRTVTIEAPDGSVIALTPDGALKSPRGLAPAAGGAGFYVADQGYDDVALVAPSGNVTVARSGLQNPVALADDPSGATWVADDHAITNVGSGATISAPPGESKWDHPSGLTFDQSGTLYVAERRPATANGARIVRGTPDGAGGYTWDADPIATEGAGVGQVIEPGGIAVNAAGTTLLVADTGNNRVQRFDAPGVSPPVTHNLGVVINTMAGGTVVSDLPGISCVTDCSQHYGGGRTVTLAETPKAGFTFTGWSGDCAGAGTAPTCALPMTDDHVAGANFAPIVVATPVPKPAPVPVKLLHFTVSPNTLHPARTASKRLHRKARKATHAHLRVTLNQAATSTVRVLVGKTGRKSGSRCVPVTKKTKRRKACTRFVALAGHRTVAKQSSLSLVFTTLWNKRQLKPGSYEVSVAAVAPSGLELAPVVRHFTVTR